MAQYIDKAALLAEIEKLEKALKNNCKPNPFGNVEECMIAAELQALDVVKEIIETTEVKEVNLDYIKDELDKVVKIYKPDGNFGWGTLYNIATHFFELGLKAQEGE